MSYCANNIIVVCWPTYKFFINYSAAAQLREVSPRPGCQPRGGSGTSVWASRPFGFLLGRLGFSPAWFLACSGRLPAQVARPFGFLPGRLGFSPVWVPAWPRLFSPPSSCEFLPPFCWVFRPPPFAGLARRRLVMCFVSVSVSAKSFLHQTFSGDWDYVPKTKNSLAVKRGSFL